MISYIKESRKYKYKLTAGYSFALPKEFDQTVVWYGEFISVDRGLCTLHKNYAWDGPSGPTIDTEDFQIPALEHDGEYNLFREGIFPVSMRVFSDKKLKRRCKENRMPWWRRQYVYWGVRVGGGSSAKPTEKKVFIAP